MLKVKNFRLLHFQVLSGYSFQMKALHAINEREALRYHKLSVEKFKTALTMDPSHLPTLMQIFEAIVALGHNEVARSLYVSSSNACPNHFLVMYRWATFCEKIGEMTEAEENYLNSLQQ